jgi:hypothetical protein
MESQRIREREGGGGGKEWALSNIELIALILMFYVISLSLFLLEEISIFHNIGSSHQINSFTMSYANSDLVLGKIACVDCLVF